MHRRLVHRGAAVLALTATLALAGALPASAQDLGLFERGMLWLARLWSPPAPADNAHSVIPATETVDRGLGLDPNGTRVLVPADPPGPDGH